MNEQQRCGYIAIIGRPNVGKSTLLNGILGQKISITSPKPQTTRSQILGIKTVDSTQAIYIDTPGWHDNQKGAMNRYLNRLATSVIMDANVILFMITATQFTAEDEKVLSHLEKVSCPVILLINKVDTLKDKSRLLPFMEKMREKYDFAAMIPLSAKKKDNVVELQQTVSTLLPEGPHLFPEEQVTDKSVRFQIAELIREKVIQATEQELPYSTTVEIEHVQTKEKMMDISAIIWVEREGQKPIVIGKNGARLKKIGTAARKDIQILVKQKVFLRLWVKVKAHWTEDERTLNSTLPH